MGNRHTMYYMGKEYPNIPIGGGAGGGGGELTLLAGTGDTVMSIGNHTLADSLANYDSVLVCVCYQQYTETGLPPAEYPIDLIKIQATDRSYAHYASLGYCDFRYIDDNTIATLRYSGVSITAIYGIKYGGGSGGGGSQYTETELFVNSGTSVADITLSDSLTNYDELYFDFIRIADGRNYHVPYSYKTSIIPVGSSFQCFGYNEYASFDVASATSLTKVNNSGNWYIAKIIGIKY